jgi:hypothetical protein
MSSAEEISNESKKLEKSAAQMMCSLLKVNVR